MTKIRPLGNKLAIVRAQAEERLQSGIYVPDSAQKKPHRGEVIAVGPGFRADSGELIKPSSRVGSIVLFPEALGVDFTIDGRSITFIDEDSVLAILED